MSNLVEDLERISTLANHSLKSLKNKSIFITGGTGFFGKWLLETFIWVNENLSYNIQVTVLSRNPNKFKEKFPHLIKNIKFVQGDIESFIFPKTQFDFIIHAATQASNTLNKEQPGFMLENIISGTRHILEFAKKAKVKRILHTSSGAAYGRQPLELKAIPETFTGSPKTNESFSAYGEGKRVSELMGTIFAEETGIDFINARCFAFCGPYLPLDGTYAIGNFIKNLLNNEDIIIQGDGTPLRSYLYAGDLIVWLLAILTHGKNKEIYNVGGSETFSIKELGKEVSSFSNDIKVVVKKAPTTGTLPTKYVPDVSLVKNELSLTENYSINEMIEKTVRHSRKQQ